MLTSSRYISLPFSLTGKSDPVQILFWFWGFYSFVLKKRMFKIHNNEQGFVHAFTFKRKV